MDKNSFSSLIDTFTFQGLLGIKDHFWKFFSKKYFPTCSYYMHVYIKKSIFFCIESLETVLFYLASPKLICLICNIHLSATFRFSLFSILEDPMPPIFRAELFNCLALMTKCVKPIMTEELTCLSCYFVGRSFK